MFEYLAYATESTQSISGNIALQSLYASALYRQAKSKPGSAVPYYLLEEAVSLVEEIKELRDGWAGEGSIAPSQTTIDRTIAAVQHIYIVAPFADISPMPNGTIAFDWELDGATANLEIGDTQFSFYLDGPSGFFPLSGKSESIPRQLGGILSQSLYGTSQDVPTPATSYTSRSFAPRPEYA
ncbi:hypothetical protein V2K91_25420 [Pseudomonas alliivorans]|nr:hypothetical protein [Pseudomonas alliivorans]